MQDTSACASSLHLKVEGVWLEENVNVAEVVLTVPVGPELIVVVGGEVTA